MLQRGYPAGIDTFFWVILRLSLIFLRFIKENSSIPKPRRFNETKMETACKVCINDDLNFDRNQFFL